MKIERPKSDYDPAWLEYWAARPSARRSVGAAGEDGEGEGVAGEAGTESREAPSAGEGAVPPPADATDWRSQITDEKLRDHAGRFSTLTDLVKGNLDLRSERDRLKNESFSIPGEDADEEDIKAFREKLGVPESPEGYEFPDPPEGQELTEFEQQSQQQWAQRFHEMGVPKDTAAKLVESWRQDMAQAAEAVAEQDKQFAAKTEEVLKQEWGEDYATNKKIAASAGPELFGEDWDAMKEAQTKDGRLLLDDPAMLRMLAKVGREMQEGSMGAITDDQRETLEDQANDARRKRDEARGRNDTVAANKWDERERELLAKIYGNAA